MPPVFSEIWSFLIRAFTRSRRSGSIASQSNGKPASDAASGQTLLNCSTTPELHEMSAELSKFDVSPFLPAGDASAGWLFGCSLAGASHVRVGKPCQDAYGVWSGAIAGQGTLVAAVADGHGDARHDQSQTGAGLAVRSAIEELVCLHTQFHCDGSTARIISNFKTNFPRRLGKRWRESVKADAASRICDSFDSSRDDSALLARYGTTLLAALAVENSILLGQIGDGEAILVRKDGSVEMPLACETEEVGGLTDSLCTEDSDKRWRTGVVQCPEGAMLLLTTDGLVNAFVDPDQLRCFARSLRERIHQHGFLNVAAALPEWLEESSLHGSGDDMTVALVMIHPRTGRQEAVEADTTSIDSSSDSQGDTNVVIDREAGLRGDRPEAPRGEEEAR